MILKMIRGRRNRVKSLISCRDEMHRSENYWCIELWIYTRVICTVNGAFRKVADSEVKYQIKRESRRVWSLYHFNCTANVFSYNCHKRPPQRFFLPDMEHQASERTLSTLAFLQEAVKEIKTMIAPASPKESGRCSPLVKLKENRYFTVS